MEVRVESAAGFDVPAGCYVGVRVGDVLKQGRYEPQRCYNFPSAERRRNAKIDVYRHVGSCVVAIEPEGKATYEVDVSSSDPTAAPMRFKVNVQGNTVDGSNSMVESKLVDAQKQRDTRTRAVKSQAKGYLAQHNIEAMLSEAVKSLLKEQPEDPTSFLCKMLMGASLPASPVSIKGSRTLLSQPLEEVALKPFNRYYSKNCLPSSGASCLNSIYAKFPLAAPRLQPAKQSMNIGALQKRTRDNLVKAREDGTLATVMAQANQKPAVAVSSLAKPFHKYYSANCIPSLGPSCMNSIYEKFPLAAPHLQPAEQSLSLDAIKKRTRETLLKAKDNGSLATAMNAAKDLPAGKPGKEDANVEVLRKRARGNLLKAKDNGSLAAAMVGAKEKTDDIDLRKRTCDTLVQASRDGALIEALQGIQRKPRVPDDERVRALRNRARDALVTANTDGVLGEALNQIQALSQGRSNGFSQFPSVGTWLARPQKPRKVLVPCR